MASNLPSRWVRMKRVSRNWGSCVPNPGGPAFQGPHLHMLSDSPTCQADPPSVTSHSEKPSFSSQNPFRTSHCFWPLQQAPMPFWPLLLPHPGHQLFLGAFPQQQSPHPPSTSLSHEAASCSPPSGPGTSPAVHYSLTSVFPRTSPSPRLRM